MIVLVGQAPDATDGAPLNSLSRCGRRLSELAGSPVESWSSQRVNLIERYPGKDAAYDHAVARDAASRLMESWYSEVEGRIVLMLGVNVVRAFGLAGVGWFMAARHPYALALVPFPHPSGLSRWWNDPRNFRLAAGYLRLLIDEDRRSDGERAR